METSEVKDVKVQAKMFPSASMNVLSKYVQVERGVESPYCNDDKLRETMKTIAVMLSNAPPDLKSTIVTLIVQEEYNLITPLALFIHQQFNGESVLISIATYFFRTSNSFLVQSSLIPRIINFTFPLWSIIVRVAVCADDITLRLYNQ